ncbi:murein L,D-transpeptidase catalytic domain family protein [Novosphingobium sp. SL115]|uniref:murein L,D-transpeptidase catalytic domain family protein n=1 Tax=Novosphingobium sp. SL115 TaxID=2995150 RepID=UPI0022754174|nr:murein L,D-transpeptidase catalytic domain family protein [Novosphingobium sp. SL115]MCY1672015.1 murein L,D-transpeptidase catalytic domain family protein [Novosphingobium sp. SL115]
MVPDRRQFLGAMVATLGSMAVSGQPALAVTPPREIEPSPFSRPTPPLMVQRAVAALDAHAPYIRHRDLVGLVDFSKASREARFHLIDIEGGKVLSSHLVSHGSGSDPANSGWVQQFSNRYGSNASSPGAFLTGVTYSGKHGRSRRLIGLEAANSAAMERGIVIHAASYVSKDMAESQGRIGRSQGCFAFSNSDISGVLERLGEGRLLYAVK